MPAKSTPEPELIPESPTPGPKLNESSLSTVLGIGVIVIIGALIFNYFRTGSLNFNKPATPTPEPTTTQLSGQESPEEAQKIIAESPQPVSYTVKAGDTLWKIAENTYKSGYAWNDIAKANNLTNPNLIEPDQNLTLPKVDTQYPPTSSGLVAGAQVEPIQGDSYTVQSGDNLWDIAVRAYADGYRWPEIAQANNLANPSIIHSGNVFAIPRP